MLERIRKSIKREDSFRGKSKERKLFAGMSDFRNAVQSTTLWKKRGEGVEK